MNGGLNIRAVDPYASVVEPLSLATKESTDAQTTHYPMGRPSRGACRRHTDVVRRLRRRRRHRAARGRPRPPAAVASRASGSANAAEHLLDTGNTATPAPAASGSANAAEHRLDTGNTATAAPA